MDLLLNRYGISVLDVDIETGVELIQEAYKKRLDERLWERWLIDYARMDKEHFIGFNDYKKELSKPAKINETVKSKPKTKEEIYEQADKIIAAWRKTH